ncbi:MAG: hypothetical protein ACXW2U_03070 [Telluria sp.]
MLKYFLLAPVLAVAAVTVYIGNFAHAIPDRNEDFSVFLPAP